MIIIPQTKGGVGKSTVAMQIVAPFLYKYHGKKIKYIEIDDENQDSKVFNQTDIVERVQLGTNRLSELDELLLMDDKHEVILDVGGNKTTTLVLSEIKKVGTFGNVKWVIPLGDGELDGKNALTTLNRIIEVEPCSNSNVMFVLSRAISMQEDYLKEQFINFFGHPFVSDKSVITSVLPNPNFLAVKNDKVITLSRYIGSTVFEIANSDIDFSKKVLEAKESKNMELVRKFLFFRRVQTESKEYVKDVLEPNFEKLTNWIKD